MAEKNTSIISRLYKAPKTLLLSLIRFYQMFLSFDTGFAGKLIPLGRTCRFTPTCSEFAYQAIERYGILYGSWLAMSRILRCHPWNPGGWDPIPEKNSHNRA
jgi:putative membrane protein insertion efficiency factor